MSACGITNLETDESTTNLPSGPNDMDVIAGAIRPRGHGQGDVLHLPEFDLEGPTGSEGEAGL